MYLYIFSYSNRLHVQFSIVWVYERGTPENDRHLEWESLQTGSPLPEQDIASSSVSGKNDLFYREVLNVFYMVVKYYALRFFKKIHY